MVLRDPNTLDLTQQKLQMAEDVMFWPVHERGELVYRIEIPKLHRFFRVGYEEYVFLSLLDGATTIPQACGLSAAKLGTCAPTTSQAEVIGRWLLENDLAYLDGDGPPVRRLAGAAASSSQNVAARLIGRLNPFWIKVPLPYLERWMNVGAGLFRPLMARPAVLLGTLLIVVASIVLVSRWHDFIASSSSIFHPSNWIWLIVTWVALKAVHELAHAVACIRQGGTVRESGLVFILFAPLAYIDVTSCWRMSSRWSRIAVASAGMYLEMVIAAAAVIAWAFIDAPQARFLLHNLVFAAGLSTLLFNANVLMRFDGYFILADLIEVPNLYMEASSMVRRLAKRLVTGEETSSGNFSGWRKPFLLLYGLAALMWRVVVCISLAIAASAMLAGGGVVIAVLGILVWTGSPLRQLYRFAQDLRGRDPNRFIRGVVVSIAAICIAAGMLFHCPIPTAVHVPGVARYLPETMVRSRVSGFVSDIHVADGDFVEQGDLLMELENRELTARLEQLEIASEQNRIRMRKATDQHDASEQQVLDEYQRSVVEQLRQLRVQAAGLRVLAPRRGHVVARGLEATIGTYIHEGDSLLVVASEADKEVVAMIDQDVIKEVRPLVGTQLRLRLASFDVTTGTLDRIEPRATEHLPDPSLAATEGGDLAVQAASRDDDLEAPRLLEPHFRGRIGLAADIAAGVPVGMRVQVSMGYRTEPIASRVARAIRRLWHAAQDDATTY